MPQQKLPDLQHASSQQVVPGAQQPSPQQILPLLQHPLPQTTPEGQVVARGEGKAQVASRFWGSKVCALGSVFLGGVFSVAEGAP
ncbi:MAG TPA: hypothetical protein VN631_16540 [Negativicutes bacterium]|nr:hypothetical protein [Negativicutes bacterium]